MNKMIRKHAERISNLVCFESFALVAALGYGYALSLDSDMSFAGAFLGSLILFNVVMAAVMAAGYTMLRFNLWLEKKLKGEYVFEDALENKNTNIYNERV